MKCGETAVGKEKHYAEWNEQVKEKSVYIKKKALEVTSFANCYCQMSIE